MKKTLSFFVLYLFFISANGQHLPSLSVHPAKRYLQTENGMPFFYLGDTSWELFHKLNFQDAAYYLRNRASKGYNVIQSVLLAELNGLTVPNKNGHLPLIDQNPSTPNEEYFKDVDKVIEQAEQYGLYMAILPTWGAHVVKEVHPLFPNIQAFNKENAYTYGLFLGKRYKDKNNIIWVLGGDRDPAGYEEVWDAMAKGLKEGCGKRHLVSFHPRGYMTSSTSFHDRKWLDFNMIQSGHARRYNDNHRLISNDYHLEPVKPVFDSEPCYEGNGIGFNAELNGFFNDYDVRYAAYQAVFSGAFGHAYGHSSVWCMYDNGEQRYGGIDVPWIKALEAPGASQMGYLKDLMLSRPFFSRIPDQSVLLNNDTQAFDRLAATRDGSPSKNDASYIMVYTPIVNGNISIRTGVIASKQLSVWLFNPRSGIAYPLGVCENKGSFSLPWEWRIREEMGGPDWVIVIDDAQKHYPAPGTNLYKN
ncbi:MAG: glycoside hydrolase family 140 protein [Bacteroidales bacterium]|nr:glycoside hydrolase family 140 protein [Bacteroidales bacterium]